MNSMDTTYGNGGVKTVTTGMGVPSFGGGGDSSFFREMAERLMAQKSKERAEAEAQRANAERDRDKAMMDARNDMMRREREAKLADTMNRGPANQARVSYMGGPNTVGGWVPSAGGPGSAHSSLHRNSAPEGQPNVIIGKAPVGIDPVDFNRFQHDSGDWRTQPRADGSPGPNNTPSGTGGNSATQDWYDIPGHQRDRMLGTQLDQYYSARDKEEERQKGWTYR